MLESCIVCSDQQGATPLIVSIEVITSVNIQEFMSQSLVSSLLQTADVHLVNYDHLESNRPWSTGCMGGGTTVWLTVSTIQSVQGAGIDGHAGSSSSQSGSTPCSSKYGSLWFQVVPQGSMLGPRYFNDLFTVEDLMLSLLRQSVD